MKTQRLIPALLFAILLLAGCGGGGSGGGGGSSDADADSEASSTWNEMAWDEGEWQ